MGAPTSMNQTNGYRGLVPAILLSLAIGISACSPRSAALGQPANASANAESTQLSGNAATDSIAAILAQYPHYQTVAVFEGGVSNAEKTETLILINDPDRIVDAGIHETVQRLIWIPEDLRKDRHIDVLFLSTGYTAAEIDMLADFMHAIDSAHPTFGFSDLTGDGRKELMLLSTHGMGTSLLIVTVANGQLRYLMRGQESMNVIMSMRLVSPPGEVPIRFRLEGLQTREGTADDTDTESPWRWAEYAWDEEAGEFVVSGAGILDEEPGD